MALSMSHLLAAAAAAVTSLLLSVTVANSAAVPAGFLQGWKPASGTWYGAPDGAGSDGMTFDSLPSYSLSWTSRSELRRACIALVC